MYIRRLQLSNYGPIRSLDLSLPFTGSNPQPLLLVGANGSGKTILVSHIVNALLSAKSVAYPDSPEVEKGKVYKLRSSTYIHRNQQYSFARVDFGDAWAISELRTRDEKRHYDESPDGILGSDAASLWDKLESHNNDHFDSSFASLRPIDVSNVRQAFATHCVLYFPSNRSEEPAWLNKEHLTAKAKHLSYEQFVGRTSREIVCSSPLIDNQNWLFDVHYDRSAFELLLPTLPVPFGEDRQPRQLQLFAGYSGPSSMIYSAVEQMIRTITRRREARIRIGSRRNRIVAIEYETQGIANNVFHLSSGEMSMLNIVLSILRDYDLAGGNFHSVSDVRGVVVIDEIDLNLHASSQYQTLPELLKLFPGVQFIITTHSPLFVLGMEREYGQDGFALYSLPDGSPISAEEFSEFGDAFEAMSATRTFATEIRVAIESASPPVVIVEGTTDMDYVKTAAMLLDKTESLARVGLLDGGGQGKMDKLWKTFTEPISEVLPRQVLLLYDCDKSIEPESHGPLDRRALPLQDNPLSAGIENLFTRSTLERAIDHKSAFVDITESHEVLERGVPKTVPEIWKINDNEKRNLCDWICENGTADDFEGFHLIFELLDEVFDHS